MDSIVIFLLVGLAILIWLGLKRLFGSGGGRKSRHADSPYRPVGVPDTIEQYPAEPRTKPRQLSWRQREILSAANSGLLIYPVPSEDQGGMVSETHYYVQRRPVKALVLAGFLEFTPKGYRITPSGSEGLRRLPERGN